MAEAELDTFEEKWVGKYASIAPAWRRAWTEVIPFFGFDPAIRKIIYTRMRSKRLFCWFLLFFSRAVDLVAKRGVLAGSVTGQPIQSLPV